MGDDAKLYRGRRPVISYTDEDWAIMKRATQRWLLQHDVVGLATVYVTGDRLDAHFMLFCQQHHTYCGVFCDEQWVDFRGARR